MRIIHIDAGRELRGRQRQLLRLALGLAEHSHDQVVVCPEGSPLELRARAEGLRSAALLAMAHARPVVASRAGGLSEVAEDGVTGRLVPPSSAEELAQVIHKSASDALRLARFGAVARERARQFSTAIMVDRTEQLHRSLIGH